MTREELNEKKQVEIFKEEKKELRKKYTIKVMKITLIIIIIFILFFLYTKYISTGSIIVKEKRLIIEKLPSSFNGTKIIHFSDLHYGSNINYEKFEEIISLINNRNPDIVLFSGDLLANNYKATSKDIEKLITQLKSIKATLGKYAIMGDEDRDSFSTIMNQSDFTVLNNDYDLIYNNSNDAILLMGFSSIFDVDKGTSYFNLENANTNIYSIALYHEPDYTDNILSKHNVDLLLAGHSHNGNIIIPYIGSLIKKDGAKKYNQEYYKIGNSNLYISSGLGTDGDGIRLFCKPSINFFRVSNS